MYPTNIKSEIEPCCAFATLRATIRCRMAQAITNSGTNNASTTSFTRRRVTVSELSCGPGIFGWAATQMHEKMVAKQLQIIFQNDLHWCRLSQDCNVLSSTWMVAIGLTR